LEDPKELDHMGGQHIVRRMILYMYLKGIGFEGLEQIQVAQNRVQWWTFLDILVDV
jgi:hypothetical protein